MNEPKNTDLDLDLNLDLTEDFPLTDETPVALTDSDSALEDGAEIDLDPKSLDSPAVDFSALGNVIEMDGSVSRNLRATELENAKTEMYHAMQSQSILIGTIVSYCERNQKLYLEVNYRGLGVFIPMDEFLDSNTSDIAKESVRLQSRYALNWMGSSTEFVVVRYVRDGTTCIGSRAKAHNRLRQRFFARNTRTDKMLYEVGSIVRCRVNYVRQHWMSVNFCGVDCRILNRDISYQRIDDLRKYFANDQMIAVKITSLSKSKTPAVHKNDLPSYHVELTLSRKEAAREEQLINYNKYNLNSRYIATVTNVHPSGRIYVRMPDGISCLCSDKTQIRTQASVRSNFISVGDRVHILITAKDDQQMLLYGIIFRCDRIKKSLDII